MQTILCVLVTGLAGGSFGSSALTNEFNLRVWNRTHGLPGNSVLSLLQTRDGCLWIGTSGGLARFDGLSFQVFSHSTHDEFESDAVRALAEDGRGRLWVGTDAGLLRFENGQSRRYTTADGLPSDQVFRLCAASNGDVWIGTMQGFVRVRAERMEIIPSLITDDPFKNQARAIHQDAAGRVWFSTLAGLNRWEPETGRVEDVGWLLGEHPAAVAIHSDPATNVWVQGPFSFTRVCPGPPRVFDWPRNGMDIILASRDGRVWYGSDGNGLFRLEGEAWRRYARPGNGLPNDRIRSLLQDRDSNIWVGTDGGLACLQPRRFQIVNADAGLPDANVWTLCPARQGGLWIGTDNGVAHWRTGTVAVAEWSSRLANPRIRSLHEDNDGTLWIGTGDSLEVWDGNTLKTVRWDEEGAANKIRTILRASSGALWVGRVKGLMRLRDGVWKRFGIRDGLPNEDVRVIREARDGAVWLGTAGGGLCRLTEAGESSLQVQVFNRTNGLPSNHVWALHQDGEGVIWAGTERGLARLERRGGTWRASAVSSRQGLFSEEVNEILEDGSGHLWLSCDRGIYRVAKQELDDVIAGRSPRVHCTVYDDADGMVSAETNGQISQPAGCRTPDGRLWFPTTGGLVGFDPGLLATETNGPSVAIEKFQADQETIFESAPGRPFPQGGHFALAPGRARVLEIQYIAPTFRAPDRVRFRYRLRGLNEEWTDAGNRRTAVFAGLRPGNYQFEVMAANNRELWSAQPSGFSFRVEPYLYQTAGFWIGVGLLLTALIALVVRWRLAELKLLNQLESANALARERERIARDMHDDLGAGLTRVALLGQRLAPGDGDPQAAHARVERLTAEASQLVDNLGELVWATDSRNDQLEDLLRFLREQAGNFLADAGIAARLDFPVIAPRIAVAGALRRDLLLAFKEAVNNAVRHAGGTEITVTCRVMEAIHLPVELELVIADNGRGFDFANGPARSSDGPLPSGSFSGTGLAGIRTRLQRHHGRLEIQSAPGQGATLTLRVPLNGIP